MNSGDAGGREQCGRERSSVAVAVEPNESCQLGQGARARLHLRTRVTRDPAAIVHHRNPGRTTPELIDNGPGGTVHVVAGDLEPGGSGAALFTQLGADGNIRLYGVENIPGPGFTRPPIFGQALCTDAASLVAGCVTARLDPVSATLAPPKIGPDTSAILSGSVKSAKTPPGTAAAARRTARSAEIAIQRTSGKRCSWWSPPRRRFVPRSCYKPLFFAVKVTGSRWKLHTGRLGKGAATVWVRAVSGRRVQQVFRNGTNKRAVRIKRTPLPADRFPSSQVAFRGVARDRPCTLAPAARGMDGSAGHADPGAADAHPTLPLLGPGPSLVVKLPVGTVVCLDRHGKPRWGTRL